MIAELLYPTLLIMKTRSTRHLRICGPLSHDDNVEAAAAAAARRRGQASALNAVTETVGLGGAYHVGVEAAPHPAWGPTLLCTIATLPSIIICHK